MALTLHGTVSDNTVALDRKRSVPIVINGDMQIAQRGTSSASFSSAAGGSVEVIDRITNAISDNGTWTITQDTDVPTGQGFTKSMKLDCTTADTSVASGSFHTIEYRMEGQDLQFIGKGTSGALYLTIAFWFKSSVTGDYAIELMDDDNNRHIGATFTIGSADTWTKIVKSFVGDTSGALGNDNGRSLRFNIFLGAGSSLTSGSAPSSWGTRVTANIAHGQTVNAASSTDNNVYITGLQIEASSNELDADNIPAFQFEDAGTSLARCQRYFTKTLAALEGSSGGSGSKKVFWYFKQTMRATPTISFVSGAKDGDTFLTADGYGIFRTGDNSPNIGSGTTAESEL